MGVVIWSEGTDGLSTFWLGSDGLLGEQLGEDQRVYLNEGWDGQLGECLDVAG